MLDFDKPKSVIIGFSNASILYEKFIIIRVIGETKLRSDHVQNIHTMQVAVYDALRMDVVEALRNTMGKFHFTDP